MGCMPASSPAYLEVDRKFITKPLNIANYFHDKVNNLKGTMT